MHIYVGKQQKGLFLFFNVIKRDKMYEDSS